MTAASTKLGTPSMLGQPRRLRPQVSASATRLRLRLRTPPQDSPPESRLRSTLPFIDPAGTSFGVITVPIDGGAPNLQVPYPGAVVAGQLVAGDNLAYFPLGVIAQLSSWSSSTASAPKRLPRPGNSVHLRSCRRSESASGLYRCEPGRRHDAGPEPAVRRARSAHPRLPEQLHAERAPAVSPCAGRSSRAA